MDVDRVIDGLYRLRSDLKFMCAGIHRDYYNNSMIYVNNAIQTIRELQEDCNRYHEWGMHEGYEEAKEKYKCKYCNTEHKECSHGNTIVIEEVCEWKLFDEETNAYNTTCGGAFWFNDGSPKDNGFKYCPYCGRKIKVVE